MNKVHTDTLRCELLERRVNRALTLLDGVVRLIEEAPFAHINLTTAQVNVGAAVEYLSGNKDWSLPGVSLALPVQGCPAQPVCYEEYLAVCAVCEWLVSCICGWCAWCEEAYPHAELSYPAEDYPNPSCPNCMPRAIREADFSRVTDYCPTCAGDGRVPIISHCTAGPYCEAVPLRGGLCRDHVCTVDDCERQRYQSFGRCEGHLVRGDL